MTWWCSKQLYNVFYKILIDYSKFTLILILTDAQYLQNVVFSFDKGLNGWNHSSSDSQHHIIPPPFRKTSLPTGGNPPNPLMLFRKPC